MTVDNWSEIRTAYCVAREGTVSGAADKLGVHHATVIRHIDALEKRLGTRLFHRHARGYTPTEAGEDLLQVAQATEEQLAHLVNRIRGRGEEVSGELRISSVPGLADLVVPAIGRFQALHPALRVHYASEIRTVRLEYGEAHVALRGGTRPEEPDNVVSPLLSYRFALYATQSYIDTYGLPASTAEFREHRFVGQGRDYSRAPFNRWLYERVPDENFVFVSPVGPALRVAVKSGIGIGFMRDDAHLEDPDLVRVFPEMSDPDWSVQAYIVTHVDTHRTAKVHQFVDFIRKEAKGWSCQYLAESRLR